MNRTRGLFLLLLVAALGLWTPPAHAQDFETSLASYNLKDRANAGSTLIDASTGRLNYVVPLYTLRDNDIEVPIRLVYDGSGVKIDDASGVVGLKWSLQAGGAVYRSVNQIPDEWDTLAQVKAFNELIEKYKDEVNINFIRIPESHAGGWIVNGVNPCHYGEKYCNATLDGYPMTHWCNPNAGSCYDLFGYLMQNKNAAVYQLVDVAPDDFTFMAGDFAGEFILKKDGTVQHLEQKDILLEQRLRESAPAHAFALTDSRGLRYAFDRGGIQYAPHGGPRPDPDVSLFTYDSEFPLTRIDSPAGRSVAFTYDILFGFTGGREETEFCEFDSCPSTYMEPGYFDSDKIWRMFKTPVVREIRSSRETVRFTYENPWYDPQEQNPSDATNTLLRRIEVFNRADEQLVKHYEFTYEGVGRHKKLKRIEEVSLTGAGRVLYREFTYDPTPLPAPDSLQKDVWGYFNANPADNLVPVGSCFDGHAPADRSYHPERLQAGVLKEVRYVTGGRTTFAYAPKTGTVGGTEVYAGGLVIEKISDFDADGTPAGSKAYRYEDLVGFALDPSDESLFTGYFEFLRKGFSSSEADLCVVVPCMGSRTYPGGPAPNCYYYMNRISASEPLKAIFDPDSLYRDPQTGAFENAFKAGGSFYRKVTVEFEGEGREVLHFEVRQTANSVKGMIVKAELFNAAAAKLKELRYNYRLEELGAVYYSRITHRRGGGWPEGMHFYFEPSHKIHGWLFVDSIVTTLFGDGGTGAFTTTEEFEYSPERHRNPIRRKAMTSEGGEQVTEIRYAHELFENEMIAANMVGIPLEVRIAGGAGGGRKTVFRKWPDGSILPWKYYESGNHPGGCMEESLPGWTLTAIVSGYENGLPTAVRSACYAQATEFEWAEDLLVEKRYGDRAWSNEYFTGDHRSGLVSRSQDFDGQSATYDYDDYRRLKRAEERNGEVAHAVSYHLAPGESWRRTETTLAGIGFPVPAERVHFDGFGREHRAVYEGYTSAGGDYEIGVKFDSRGRVARYCDPGLGGCMRISYENAPLDRPVREQFIGWPRARDLRYGVNGAGEVGGYPAGALRRTEEIDENGNAHVVFTDRLGRTVLSRRPAAGQPADTAFQYDARGNPVKIVQPDGSEIVMTYHGDGRLATRSTPQNGTVAFAYNSRGLLSTTSDAAGNVTTFLYDIYDQPRLTYLNGKLVTRITYGEAGGIANGKVLKVESRAQGELSIFVTTHYAYDAYGRLKTEKVVNHTGGEDETTYTYDLRDRVLRALRVHAGSYGTIDILKEYNYDHAGRLTDVFMTVGNGPREHLSALAYNARDWLVEKNLGIGANGPLQSIDYGYNLRGWLTRINSLRECGDKTGPADETSPADPTAHVPARRGITFGAGCENVENDLFSEQLTYTSANSTVGAAPQYNGNPSTVRWRVMDRPVIPAYGLQYDPLDRLTKATYGERTVPTSGAPAWTNMNRYDVQIGPYDPAGNPLRITRYGVTGGSAPNLTFGQVDDLAFTYSSGRLDSAAESGSKSRGYTGLGGTYLYDANGNLSRDPSKNLDIAYNAYNLPETVTLGVNRNLRFTYDSFGNKLRMKLTDTGELSTVDYLGGIEYKGGDVVVYHEEGRYRLSDGRYEYVLRDHGGNTRLVFADRNGNGAIDTDPAAGEVLQEHHYYPHGMAMEGDFITPAAGGDSYLYNGLERLPRHGLYGSHFRTYDPSMARWWQADPVWLASESPYVANRGNPIRYADPTGAQPEDLLAVLTELGLDPDDLGIILPLVTVTASYNDEPGSDDYWMSEGADPYYYGWAFDVGGQDYYDYETRESERFDWSSLIPVYGSGKDAVHAFKEGRWLAGIGNTALAVSDVFLVKSVFVAGGKLALKGGLKLSGTHSWSATKSYWSKKGIQQLSGGSKHHWLISQKLMNRYPQLKPVGNQFWNIKNFSTHADHIRLAHGQTYGGLRGAGPLGQVWYGTPTWPKAVIGSYGGRAAGYNLGDFEDP
jgi:RHS repeat-associated protein